MNETKAKPFLKWVGGKRSIMKTLLENVPTDFNDYFEPFVGGGALFFELLPKSALLSDINSNLISAYSFIKKNPTPLIELLINHQSSHNENHYYEMRRQLKAEDTLEMTARFIYLNKTCFNGLYRENKKGEFNVPIGNYDNPLIADKSNIMACHSILKHPKIVICRLSFTESLLLPKKNDFVYLDPPYHKVSTSSFTRYNQNDFDENKQIILRDNCVKLHNNGVKFMLSNSDTPFINDLYKDFDIKVIGVNRAINSDATKRGKVNEVLIKNY